jgi:trk system potassium uptake protein TrkH
MSLLGCLPFVLSGEIPRFIDALFEITSGFTTTGASVVADVEALSHGILYWRSFSNWLGGMGVLVFLLAFLPLSGGRNMHIMRAESPGPDVSKLVPRVRTTAMILYSIYLAMTAVQFVLLLFGGMDVFESLCTAFSTAGTGGFGLKNDSLASATPYVQIVVTVFMLLFSVNFNSYYLLLARRPREAFPTEVKALFAMVAGGILLITVANFESFELLGDTVRHAAFAVASVVSTTGFATADFGTWPLLAQTALLLLMFVGACAGSTGGGFKLSRVLILFKNAAREVRRQISPREVKQITLDRRPISDEISRGVSTYLVVYVLIYFASLLLLSFGGGDFTTNATSVLATLNNVGPGLSKVGPMGNYSIFSIPSKFVLIFDMLAGRLELFPILVLFSPKTWRR